MIKNLATALGRLTTHPGLDMPESKRRQTELLAKILLFLLIFSIVVLFIVLFINPHNDPLYKTYVLQISGLVIFFAVSFGLNYFGQYKAAAYLLVGSAALTPWISMTFDTSIYKGDFVPLTYLAFSVLMSSILLPTNITIVLAALQLSGLVFLYIRFPSILVYNWFSFLAFCILTSIFSILANNIIQNNFKKIDLLVDQLAENESHLRELSTRDYLTNLFNRRFLEETLKREIHRVEREQHSLGVIMMDIDGFKSINDTLGHAAGDLLLQEIGKFLTNYVRQSDIACRYGGDEFVLVMADSSREVTIERAEILRDSTKNLVVEFEGHSINSVTISQGIAIYPDSGGDGEALLKAADSRALPGKTRRRQLRDCAQ